MGGKITQRMMVKPVLGFKIWATIARMIARKTASRE
jgi:hypothetical protein